jgi:DNA-binding NtrC family response regulator
MTVAERRTRGAGERTLSALVVEDDRAYARIVASALVDDLGWEVEVAGGATEGFAQAAARSFSVAVIDRALPDGDGIALLRRLRAAGRSVPVVVLTADAAPETVVAAMRAGACDYVVKTGAAIALLLRSVASAAVVQARAPATSRGVQSLVGESAVMQRLRATIRQMAASTPCVLIEGETGVGKELVARALHEEGARREGHFVAVTCGGLPEQLVESELFGHVRGAFTGAHRDHPGLVAAAARGTLFLDEIEDLPLVLQGKLLRLLQEGEYRPLGALRTRAAEIRVVAASNEDLHHLVHARSFRSDLFYRLDVLRISVPPLRERPEDIETLIDQFLARIAERTARGEDPRQREAVRGLRERPLPEGVLARLAHHPWPGNVRELGNLVERAVVFAAALGWEAGWHAATTGALAPGQARDEVRDGVRHDARPVGEATADREQDAAADVLRRLLDRHRWRRSSAASELGISRVTLWRRMRKLGLCGAAPPGEEGE